MIRGRKEGNTYASWFIGFDHDDTFGLPTFPELPTQSARTPGSINPVPRATSLESLLSLGQLRDFPIPVRSLTPAATQTSSQLSAQTQTTEEIHSKTPHQVFTRTSTQTTQEVLSKTPHQASTQTSTQTTEGFSIKTPHQVSTQTSAEITKETPDKPPHQISAQTVLNVSSESSTELDCRSRTPVQDQTKSHDFDTDRSRRRWERDAQGLYKEAFDGAKRAEEFKFRVKFDKLVGDLHLAIEEKSPNGLTTSFASPSYGEVMLTFKDKIKELIQSFTQRLQLAYESLGPIDTPENIGQKVKQNVSKFIEDLIGETLDLTSDEAVSDLSSLSDDSTPDQNLFDDLIAQAVVSKLLENFYKETNETLQSFNNNLKKVDLREQGTETQDNLKKINLREQGTETQDNLKKINLREQGTETQDNLKKINFREQGTETQDNLKKINLREQGTDTQDNLKINLREQGTETKDNLKVYLREQGTETQDNLKVDLREQGTVTQDIVIVRNQKDNFRNYEFGESVDIVDGNGKSYIKKQNETYLNGKNITSLDIVNKGSDLIPVDTEEEPEILRYQSVTSKVNNKNDIIRTANNTFGKSDSNYEIVEANGQNNVKVENGTLDEKTDFVKEFEQLKEFVKKTQASFRPKVEAISFDDSNLCEVKEEALLKTKVNRDEEREEFHTRYSVFDRVYNFQPVLPDFSQFENINFNSNETDPDLLSMNLEIIPEETEEELEEEEDEQGKWNANWLFKGKGASPYANVGEKTVSRDAEGSLYMTVPRPDDRYAPRIGNRDIDQLSDFSEYDLLGRTDFDGSDEEENTFYANTSKELARISGHHRWSDNQRRLSSRSNSEDSNFNNRHAKDEVEKINDRNTLDFDNIVNSAGHIPGPIVEPSGLLQDLSPAENDDPKFLSPPESVVVQEGEPVKFSCRVSGTGTVDVFWYREGSEIEELEESEDVEISVNGDKHSIVLYNIGKKLAGQYMCIVMNEQQSKAIQYLTVTVKDSKQELKQPVFLKGLKDVEVTEGQSVKLRVKVKGYPPPRISWYKDGELLKRSKNCRIEKFGNRDYILTIDYASMNDDAEYTVSARNVAGEARMSIQVIVEPQTDLPARGQRISSTSDSDSDRNTSHQSLTSAVGSAVFTASSNKQDFHHINYLDRRVAITQKQVEKENQNILNTVEKEQSSGRQRLITANTKDVLQIAEELIQHERNAFQPVLNQTENEEMTVSYSVDKANTSSSPHISKPDNILEDLSLPDKLDEFILPEQNSKNSGVLKSASELLFTGASQHDNTESCYRDGTASEKSEASFQKQAVTLSEHVVSQHDSVPVKINTNVNSVFPGSDRLLNDAAASHISHSCNVNSRDLDQIHLEISRQQDLRDKYSRDFEVNQNKETTKWSVTLDPFSPQAEVVNRQNSVDRTLERGDNSSQSSSRRQSIDSGVSVCSKQKQAVHVHMVGHTTEDEVPESRTEFNTDGSIELPSVNRLRAMFSSISDDEMGSSSLKRVTQNGNIHSITARNVPKEQLEKLRASNQNEPSSGKFVKVPGPSKEISQISSGQLNNDVLETTSSSSSSPPNLKQVSASRDPVSMNHQKILNIPVTGAYRDFNPDKDPVLIYPETHPEYMQRHHPQQRQQQTRPQQKPSNREPSSPQNQWQTVTKSSSAAPPKPAQPQHSRLIVRQVMPHIESDNVQRSGPRIKSGCISARAAFWERKIEDNGAVNDEEFPEMVEDNSINDG